MPALASEHVRSRMIVLVGATIAALLAATVTLWAYYGTAVFFEIIRTGWVSCFG